MEECLSMQQLLYKQVYFLLQWEIFWDLFILLYLFYPSQSEFSTQYTLAVVDAKNQCICEV